MNEYGLRPETANLKKLGLKNLSNAYWNLTPAELVEETIIRGMGVLADTGAIAIDTGEFTGRSPKDRFIVCDEKTEDVVWWGDINIKFSSENFDKLYDKMTSYLQDKDVFVRDSYACSDDRYRLNIRVINEYPWSNHFADNMFISPKKDELKDFKPEWHIVNAPGFMPTLKKTELDNIILL